MNFNHSHMSDEKLTISDVSQQLFKLKKECTFYQNEITKEKFHCMDRTLQKCASQINSIHAPPVALRHRLLGHKGKIMSCAWMSDSQHLLSVAQDGLGIIWDTYTSFKTNAFLLANNWVLCCALPSSFNIAACGGLDNMISIYSIAHNLDNYNPQMGYHTGVNDSSSPKSSVFSKQAPICTFRGHSAYISDCIFLSDHSLVSASGDMTCALWELNTGQKVCDFLDHLEDVSSIAKSKSPYIFASGSSDKTVKIWDTRVGACTQTFQCQDSEINCVTFFPEGYSVVAGSENSNVQLFDLRADSQIALYSSPKAVSPPTSLSMSLSGRLMFVGHENGSVNVWDVLKSDFMGSLSLSHQNIISKVTVSPNGLGVAVSSCDMTISLLSV